MVILDKNGHNIGNMRWEIFQELSVLIILSSSKNEVGDKKYFIQ